MGSDVVSEVGSDVLDTGVVVALAGLIVSRGSEGSFTPRGNRGDRLRRRWWWWCVVRFPGGPATHQRAGGCVCRVRSSTNGLVIPVPTPYVVGRDDPTAVVGAVGIPGDVRPVGIYRQACAHGLMQVEPPRDCISTSRACSAM